MNVDDAPFEIEVGSDFIVLRSVKDDEIKFILYTIKNADVDPIVELLEAF